MDAEFLQLAGAAVAASEPLPPCEPARQRRSLGR